MLALFTSPVTVRFVCATFTQTYLCRSFRWKWRVILCVKGHKSAGVIVQPTMRNIPRGNKTAPLFRRRCANKGGRRLATYQSRRLTFSGGERRHGLSGACAGWATRYPGAATWTQCQTLPIFIGRPLNYLPVMFLGVDTRYKLKSSKLLVRSSKWLILDINITRNCLFVCL